MNSTEIYTLYAAAVINSSDMSLTAQQLAEYADKVARAMIILQSKWIVDENQ